MANAITISRIVSSLILLLCPTLSASFYCVYVLTGITDFLDGFIARRVRTTSQLGAKIDTTADTIFVVVCLIKFLPEIRFPLWIYIWIVVVAIIKIINIILGFMVNKKYPAVHSVMNKITGVILFLLPLTFARIDLRYSGAFACVVATFAAIQEGHWIRTGKADVND